MREKIKEIYDTYSKKQTQIFNNNKPLLIEAFTQFYGEVYRERITYIINHVNLYFYLNFSDVPKDLKEVINSYFTFELRVIKKKVTRKERRRKLLEAIYLNPIDKKSDLYKSLEKIESDLESGLGFSFSNKENTAIYKDILLPLFGCDDLTLIHELNHIIGMHVIVKIKRDVYPIYPFEYDGTLELINEYMAIKILKIIEELKGRIFSFPPQEVEGYSSYFFLIEEFYQKFLDLIKEATITGNTRLLENKLGKDNLDSFSWYVNYLYVKEKITPEDLQKIHRLNLIMEEHRKKEQDYDYESFYQELARSGYKVRKLR